MKQGIADKASKHCCNGREVKVLDLKTNGVSPMQVQTLLALCQLFLNML